MTFDEFVSLANSVAPERVTYSTIDTEAGIASWQVEDTTGDVFEVTFFDHRDF
jgi:hypothetical protein